MQSTYEELKLISFQVKLAASSLYAVYLWGIETKICDWNAFRIRWPRMQSTYEELKLGATVTVESAEGCMQSTYEELKLVYVVYILNINFVCSLPMRNWNIKKHDLFIPNDFVCSLPMRNWNSNVYAGKKGT